MAAKYYMVEMSLRISFTFPPQSYKNQKMIAP